MRTKAQGFMIFIIVLAVIFIIAMIGYGLCVDQVEASHLGVMVKLGSIQGIMQPGIQFTGPFTDVHQYDLRLRKIIVEMNGDQSAAGKDGQAVYATIQVNYRLNPDHVKDAYQKVGNDNELAEILNIDGIIREGFKTASVKYNALEIIQNRSMFVNDAIDSIKARFPSEYFILDNVVVSNVNLNKAFTDAIEAKNANEKLAESEEQKVKVLKFQADQKVEQTRGETDSIKLQADAQAYTTRVQAEAEAEALRLKKQELNALLVENNRIDMLREKWNGQLPTWVTSDNAGMILSVNPKAEPVTR